MPSHQFGIFPLCIFFSWRIFDCKKIALPKFLYVVCDFIRSSTKVSFFIHLKFSCCTIFFLKEWWWSDWLWKGWSYLKREKKKEYNAKQHLTICLRVLRKIDGADLMEERKGGPWASPRFIVPSGNVAWLSCQLAVVWLIFPLRVETLKITNFVFNLLVAWGETSSPQSASLKWFFFEISSASVFV